MPHYYFDLKNGARLMDLAGLNCSDDADALAKGTVFAERISLDTSPRASTRYVAILNEQGDEIFKVPVRRRPAA